MKNKRDFENVRREGGRAENDKSGRRFRGERPSGSNFRDRGENREEGHSKPSFSGERGPGTSERRFDGPAKGRRFEENRRPSSDRGQSRFGGERNRDRDESREEWRSKPSFSEARGSRSGERKFDGPSREKRFDDDRRPFSLRSQSRFESERSNDRVRSEKKFDSQRGEDRPRRFERDDRFSENKPEWKKKPRESSFERPFDGKRRGDFRDASDRKPSERKFERNTEFSRGRFEKKDDFRKTNYPEVKRPNYEAKLAKREDSTSSNDGTIRLNRFIANAGICSRREADELIESGQITVNGKVVSEMGFKVKPSDIVKYGKRVLNAEKLVYILLNKPKDYITTTDDPEDRKTVLDLIKGACEERVYPVGRLDRNTTGLLLITNDGELADKLTHPSNEIRKIYQAELDKPITTEDFEKLKSGLELEDGFVKPDDVGIVTPDAYVVGIEIHSGKNRIVRRMFEHLGYDVKKLDRTTFAGLNKKDLPRGKWRFLTPKEVISLKYLS